MYFTSAYLSRIQPHSKYPELQPHQTSALFSVLTGPFSTSPAIPIRLPSDLHTGRPQLRIPLTQVLSVPRNALSLSFFLSFSLSFFLLFRATPAANGGSRARGQIGAVATGLRHSHNNARSEPHLQSTPRLSAMLDP